MNASGFVPNPPVPLPCVGVHGPAVFYVDYISPAASGNAEWHFRVHASSTPNPEDHWFDLVLEPLGPNLRSATMCANQMRYLKKGIPEAVLRFARVTTATPIVSSSNCVEGEERKPAATKAWQRIEEATYDRGTDRYALA